MPFSHHSHSGQFCSHATHTLEEMLRTAISQRMDLYCLSEHMPREAQDLYPDEVQQTMTLGNRPVNSDDGNNNNHRHNYDNAEAARKATVIVLGELFEDYYNEAMRLREEYAGKIRVLVGMEVDWIRPSSKEWIERLLEGYRLDFFVGSVHHVHEIPVDYDYSLYEQAREKSGGTDERLFEDYFDLQLEMLKALKPPIVGHFDLIRLKSDDPNASMMQRTSTVRFRLVWEKILRNLDYVKEYGGTIEINSAALRKGLSEPYPNAEICKEITARGISATLSDDAHAIDQVGTNYAKALAFAEKIGFESLACLERYGASGNDSRFPATHMKQIGLAELKRHPFFVS